VIVDGLSEHLQERSSEDGQALVGKGHVGADVSRQSRHESCVVGIPALRHEQRDAALTLEGDEVERPCPDGAPGNVAVGRRHQGATQEVAPGGAEPLRVRADDSAHLEVPAGGGGGDRRLRQSRADLAGNVGEDQEAH
jgi:hypothetical protein